MREIAVPFDIIIKFVCNVYFKSMNILSGKTLSFLETLKSKRVRLDKKGMEFSGYD